MNDYHTEENKSCILSETQEMKISLPFSRYTLVHNHVSLNQSFLNTINFFSVSTVHFLVAEVASYHSVK